MRATSAVLALSLAACGGARDAASTAPGTEPGIPSGASSTAAIPSAASTGATSASAAPETAKKIRASARIGSGCGPTDAPTTTLVVFDQEAACDEPMPAGTKTLLDADISGAQFGRSSALRGPVEWCDGGLSCERVEHATITLTGEDGVTVGEIRFTLHGQTRTVTFRALDCPTPASERVMCG